MAVAVDSHELGLWADAGTGEPFGDWELPGMGDSAPTCGEVSASHFCDTQGHIHYQRHLCGRRECPECWSSQWSKPRTVNVVSRLAAARSVAEPDPAKRTIHAVVSPPTLPNTIEGFYRGRRRANKIAKEHGIRGGVVVAHGYRATKNTIRRYRRIDPDLSLWIWIRENDTSWKEQVEWSPHYHIIGLADPESIDPESGRGGHIVPGDDREDGWVFKNIRSLSRYEGTIDISGLKDMIKAVRYILSHATFPAAEERQAVTWFGDLHGTNFNPEEELIEVYNLPGWWSGFARDPVDYPEALGVKKWRLIQWTTEQLVGADGDRNDEKIEGGRKCPEDGCEGHLHEIWEARAFLDTVRDGIAEEARHRIRVAYEWKIGKVKPPPGMKNPQSVEQAEEALAEML